jgi:hypothetical protein
LNLSTNTLNADEELYAFTHGAVIYNATTSKPTPNSTGLGVKTLTYFYCSTNGANITLGTDERASTTPFSAGTDIFIGGSVTCDSNGFTTTTFANSGIASEALINYDVDVVANASTTLTFKFYGTYDD